MRTSSLLVLCLLCIFSFSVSFGAENAARDSWVGIYSGKDRIGYSRTRIITDNGERQALEQTKLKMTVLGSDREVDTEARYLLEGFNLRQFEYSMKGGAADLKVTGVRTGNELKINIESVSGKSELTVPIVGEPVVGPVLYEWLMSKNPELGKTYDLVLFDPNSVLIGADLGKANATLTIEGEETLSLPAGTFKTHRVRMNYLGLEDTVWITRKGEVVREVSPLGIESRKEDPGDLIASGISSLDIVDKTAISSNIKIADPRGLEFLRIRIGGIESTDGLDLIDNYRQFASDGLLEIRVAPLSGVKPYEIPYAGKELDPYTRETILIPTNDAQIIKTVSSILGGERNSVEAVRKINQWVYKNLEKTPTISLPNALDVLETRKGDCNEHATLFAALARAAGIPTKIVLGLVFMDGRFYYHAWNEAFVGQWIAADPTFGQLPADATHIKFLEGDLNKSPEILRLVGKIEVKVVEAS